MAGENRQIADIIRGIAGVDDLTNDTANRAHCRVTAVDIKKRTCSAKSLTGATIEFNNVALMTVVDDGFLLVPAIDSEVIISYGRQVKSQVIMYSEIQMLWAVVGDQQLKMTAKDGIQIFNDNYRIDVKDDGVTVANSAYKILLDSNGITMNDGGYGGLTKTPTLREELNKTHELLQALITVINGAAIPEPGGGSSALQAALKGAITGMQLGVYDDIENGKITHG